MPHTTTHPNCPGMLTIREQVIGQLCNVTTEYDRTAPKSDGSAEQACLKLAKPILQQITPADLDELMKNPVNWSTPAGRGMVILRQVVDGLDPSPLKTHLKRWFPYSLQDNTDSNRTE